MPDRPAGLDPAWRGENILLGGEQVSTGWVASNCHKPFCVSGPVDGP